RPASPRAAAPRPRRAGGGTRRRAARARSLRPPELHERLLGEVLRGHGDVALLGFEEHAAVGDLDDPALELADLDVVARRVVLAHVMRTDQVREVRSGAE